MEDAVFGFVAIAAGAVFCFFGYFALRVVIAIWGAFAGFTLGAGLVASLADDAFLATGLGWLVGLLLAAVVASLAYLVYEAAVVIALASIGFAIGTSLMVALDLEWTWLIALGGVVFGLLLAFGAIATGLSTILLVVLSAMGGASAITTGLMVLSGSVDTAGFSDAAESRRAAEGVGWYLVYVGLAVAGVLVQLRAAGGTRGSMRDAWS